MAVGGGEQVGAWSNDASDSVPDSTAVWWTVSVTFYSIEVVALAFISLFFGGLSAMLSDVCYSDSTMLICEPDWQTVMVITPLAGLAVGVVAAVVFILWVRKLWSLGVAMVVTPLFPVLAFVVMEAIVTA